MRLVRLGEDATTNMSKAEEILKDYRFLKPTIRSEIDEFFYLLPEPYSSFVHFRYRKCETMEEVAHLIGYSTRNCYHFRTKVLKWWVLYVTGQKCS